MAAAMELVMSVVQRASIITIYGVVLGFSFLLVRAVYNVFFHPLASFPGPKTAAASNLPYVTAVVRGRLPHWVFSLHTTYKSPIVRISPTELSFIGADARRDIYLNRPGHTPYEKDLRIYGLPPNGVHSLLTAPKEDHTRMRKVLNHAFADKAFREQEPIVKGYLDNLIRRLHEQIQGPAHGKLDVVEWYNWMSFDVIGDLSFGQSFRCLETQTNHPWVEMIFGNLKGIALMSACNRFSVLRGLIPFLMPKSIVKMVDDHWTATKETVNKRMELGTDRSDFMSPILTHNNEKDGLEPEEIFSNASLFIIAGSESVASMLSSTTYYLLKHPEIMRKITAEVDAAFASDSDITSKSVAQLPYLLACLAETSRIHPIALTGQAMQVPPAGDYICGKWVAGGTGVSVNEYAAYRSPTNFSDPDRYIPERWLEDDDNTTTTYASDNKEVFQPFSVGPRNCIGKNLGNLESRLVLARMLWEFDMELCEETKDDWDDQKVFVTWQKTPLIVKLSARR